MSMVTLILSRRLEAGSSTALQKSLTAATADEQEDWAHAGW